MRVIALLLLFVLASSLHAGGVNNVVRAASLLCTDLVSLLPVAAMLMTMFAAVVYAAGQIMGAETRARANVWSTAAITGAMISVLMVAVAPSVLGAIFGSDLSCTESKCGNFTYNVQTHQCCCGDTVIPIGNSCQNVMCS